MRLFLFGEQSDEDHDEQADGDAQEIGVEVGGLGVAVGVDAVLLAFEKEGDEIGRHRGPAKGAPPGVFPESEGAQHREGEEHQKMGDLVEGNAQKSSGQLRIGLDGGEV